ncbi:hypothetical protein THAOC_24348 [Thalassiosira oceanica]|uniref:Uncharacterized protein n=1 Tax=Thalassiosira oceanica TaxID=159749 RepID=K0SAU0_THAOC|nr:hypothetical protein THAOC_24348 [Thalassiosira oceanica]|eukprot:EJK55867.1 hypothetical protein THAOC_24348 [Thalassiosira oceanica]
MLSAAEESGRGKTKADASASPPVSEVARCRSADVHAHSVAFSTIVTREFIQRLVDWKLPGDCCLIARFFSLRNRDEARRGGGDTSQVTMGRVSKSDIAKALQLLAGKDRDAFLRFCIGLWHKIRGRDELEKISSGLFDLRHGTAENCFAAIASGRDCSDVDLPFDRLFDRLVKMSGDESVSDDDIRRTKKKASSLFGASSGGLDPCSFNIDSFDETRDLLLYTAPSVEQCFNADEKGGALLAAISVLSYFGAWSWTDNSILESLLLMVLSSGASGELSGSLFFVEPTKIGKKYSLVEPDFRKVSTVDDLKAACAKNSFLRKSIFKNASSFHTNVVNRFKSDPEFRKGLHSCDLLKGFGNYSKLMQGIESDTSAGGEDSKISVRVNGTRRVTQSPQTLTELTGKRKSGAVPLEDTNSPTTTLVTLPRPAYALLTGRNLNDPSTDVSIPIVCLPRHPERAHVHHQIPRRARGE